MVLTFLILTSVMVVFSSLTVSILNGKLRFQFKGGFIGKTILLSNILSTTTVKTSWLAGWGIRKIPGGWMYNISGFQAVELLLKEGKKYRIGTDEPEKLIEMIDYYKAKKY